MLEELDEGVLIAELRKRNQSGQLVKKGRSRARASEEERKERREKKRTHPAGDREDVNERRLLLDSRLDRYSSWALERRLTNEEGSERLHLGELPVPLRVLSDVVSDVRSDGESTEERSFLVELSNVAHSKVVRQKSEFPKVWKGVGEDGESVAGEPEGRVSDVKDSKPFHRGDESGESGDLSEKKNVLVKRREQHEEEKRNPRRPCDSLEQLGKQERGAGTVRGSRICSEQ